MVDFILQFWGVIAAIVTSVVAIIGWFLRLEARGKANSAEIAHLKLQRHEDHREAVQSRKEMLEQLGIIAGDIKRLIEKVASK